MNPHAASSLRWAGLGADRVDWRHGARLSLAVVVAFVVSSAFQLPESFWAVMSALIVVRPTAGSALGAGWDRVRGTMSGTAIGLGGVWLHHVGVGSATDTLVIVAAVAFASAVVPALRSAPISALIVLTSGGIAGHSALDVARLRAVEIGIGVVTGLVVSLVAFATHARRRFDADCGAWLRQAAARAVDDLAGIATDDAADAAADAARDARHDASRNALRSLAELAVGADREQRWLAVFGRRRDAGTPKRSTRARLMTRVASDLGAVVRAASCAPQALDASARTQLGEAVRDALDWTADAVAPSLRRSPSPSPGPAALRAWSAADAPIPWLAAPTRLLLQDLVQVRRLAVPADGRPHRNAPETA